MQEPEVGPSGPFRTSKGVPDGQGKNTRSHGKRRCRWCHGQERQKMKLRLIEGWQQAYKFLSVQIAALFIAAAKL